MKTLRILAAAGLSAVFMLAAGCRNDGQPNNVRGISLDSQRYIRASLPVTTLDGRNLEVSYMAYCEKMDDLDNAEKKADGDTEYSAACKTYVKDSLEYFAKDRDCFEGSIPAVSPEIRNHEGLPQSSTDKCFDVYPADYALWPEDMMTRALEVSPQDNLYTVTKILPR